MLIRCIMKFEFNKFFLAKDYSKRWFIVLKNEYNSHFKKERDYYFFAEKKEGIIIDTLVPLNEEEIL